MRPHGSFISHEPLQCSSWSVMMEKHTSALELWPLLKCPGCIWGRGSSRSAHQVDTTFVPSLSYLGFALWPRPLTGPKLRAELKSTQQPSGVGRRFVRASGRGDHSGSPSHSTAVSFSVWHYHGNQVVGVLIWQACLINMCCAARQWGVGESEEGQRRNDDALSAGMKTKQKTKVKSIFWKAGCHLGG